MGHQLLYNIIIFCVGDQLVYKIHIFFCVVTNFFIIYTSSFVRATNLFIRYTSSVRATSFFIYKLYKYKSALRA